jgi:hypothetical protein
VISSPNRSARGTKPVRLVVLHTAEGARTVTELGNYFANASVQASSHVGIDDTGLEQYVPYSEAAWTILSANPISDNAELCGFAAWSRDVWLTQHMPMLRNAAAWIRGRCQARGIPIVKLTPAQVAAGRAGVIGHWDWTVGMHDGTHTDPGTAFPWDVVMSLAAQTPGPQPFPTAALEGDLMAPIPIILDAAQRFQQSQGCEAGGGSHIASGAWLTFGSTFGPTTWTRIAALSADARVLAKWENVRTGDNSSLPQKLPDGTRTVTVQGQGDNAGTRPWASIWHIPLP